MMKDEISLGRMKMSKLIRGTRLITMFLIVCWGSMAAIDYERCQQVKSPIFAKPVEVTDCNMYQGIGYTITIGYGGPVGYPGEELKGLFTWGNYLT